MKFRSIGFAILALSTTAFAQTAPAPAAVKPPLAQHSCAKPAMPDASKAIPTAEANAFIRALETFRNCVQAFSESQKQVAAAKQKEAEAFKLSALESSQAATAAAAAADAAAKDYNVFSEQAVKIVTPKEPAASPAKKAVTIEPPAPRPQRGY